jgi:hypothetical protein
MFRAVTYAISRITAYRSARANTTTPHQAQRQTILGPWAPALLWAAISSLAYLFSAAANNRENLGILRHIFTRGQANKKMPPNCSVICPSRRGFES